MGLATFVDWPQYAGKAPSKSASMAKQFGNVLKLVTYPHPVLREKCTPIAVDDILGSQVQSLVQDMLATVKLENGLGLAAPQVCSSLGCARPMHARLCAQIGSTDQIFVMRTPTAPQQGRKRRRAPLAVSAPTWHAVINPTIERKSTQCSVWPEACLSIPDYSTLTRRHDRISVKYWGADGKHRRQELTGLAAVIFQHETDHLNGMLLMDREMIGTRDMDDMDMAMREAQLRMMAALRREFGEDVYADEESR